jgi:hypothetical protein
MREKPERGFLLIIDKSKRNPKTEHKSAVPERKAFESRERKRNPTDACE